MRSRILVQVAAGMLISLLVWPAPRADAQTCSAASVRRIKKLNIDAMDENDRWELEKARQKLEDAKLVAQSRKCLTHPSVAVTYVLLGVIELRSKKKDAMVAAWNKAFTIDPKVQLPARVRSAKVLRLFASIHAKWKTAKPAVRRVTGKPVGPPKGFEHEPVLKWEEGKTLTVNVRAADNLAIQRVSFFYRTETDATPKRLELVKKAGDKWTWSVEVEGKLIRGKEFKYYLVAYATGDKEVAASGNSANMHIIQLTSAAVVKRRAGEENPLTGGTLPRRILRRRAVAVDHPLEDPDGPVRARAATGTVKKTHKPDSEFKGPAIFFASLGVGTGIGMMAGKTEVTGEDVPGAPSMGSVYGQVELGYLISQHFSVNLFFRFGGMLISKEVKEPEVEGYRRPGCITGADCGATKADNDKEYIGMLRVRYQSGKLLRADLPVNLHWYVGGGVGYGIIRHHVSALLQDPAIDNLNHEVIDTDKSVGFVPNVFAGINLSLMRSGAVSVFFEINYLAAFTEDPDLNTLFHLDFTLGANFRF